MFTVKLVRGDATKIVAGSTVMVDPLPDGSREITVTDAAGGITRYMVARSKGPTLGIPDFADAYPLAYIENANGQTTQIVRPR